MDLFLGLSAFTFRQIFPSLSSFFLRLDAVSHWASQVVPIVKNLPSSVGDIRYGVQSLDQEDLLC